MGRNAGEGARRGNTGGVWDVEGLGVELEDFASDRRAVKGGPTPGLVAASTDGLGREATPLEFTGVTLEQGVLLQQEFVDPVAGLDGGQTGRG